MPINRKFHKVTITVYTDMGGSNAHVEEHLAPFIAAELGDYVFVDRIEAQGMATITEVAEHSEGAAAWLDEREVPCAY